MADELQEQNPKESKNSSKEFRPDDSVIPEELKPILSDPEIPQEQKEKIIRAVVGISIRTASSFRGPIPPPDILQGYNGAVEGGAERIIAMAEKQSNHRMQLENHAIKEELKQSRLGQIFGFILGLVGFALATVLAMFDHETVAGIFGTTTIIGLVTVFVLGKKAQAKDLANKE